MLPFSMQNYQSAIMMPAKLQFFVKAIEIALSLAKPLKWLTYSAAIY